MRRIQLSYMPRFIYFFGPDGSGKSTHARILMSYLMARGLNVKIVWIKSYHIFAYIVSKIFAKLSPHSVVLNSYGTITRINAINKGSINCLIWAWIEFASILPWVILKVYLPLLAGKVVIAERFLIDSIVSISYTLNRESFISTSVSRLMLRLIPKNSVLVHLDSSYDAIKSRRGVMADSREYIEFQRRIYGKLSKNLRVIKIDTSQVSIEEATKTIKDYLLSSKLSVTEIPDERLIVCRPLIKDF